MAMSLCHFAHLVVTLVRELQEDTNLGQFSDYFFRFNIAQKEGDPDS